jgi:hypothetical protein
MLRRSPEWYKHRKSRTENQDSETGIEKEKEVKY